MRDIYPGKGSATPLALSNVEGRLRFTADDGSNGRTQWISDGTAEGTQPVTQRLAGEASVAGTPTPRNNIQNNTQNNTVSGLSAAVADYGNKL